MFEETEITRVNLKEGTSSLRDKIVKEVPFTIKVNNEEILTLLASPSLLKELAVGYLYVEGFIAGESDIINLVIDEKAFVASFEIRNDIQSAEKKRVITSGCGRNISFYNFEDFKNCPPIESDFTVGAERVLTLMQQFQKKSEIFKETGGVHSAALCAVPAGRQDTNKIINFAEDIGRHNAVDKIIGSLILNGISPKEKVLLLSGRISSEMLIKSVRIGIPIIVSRSAPTDMAVRLAKQLKITLAGFARGSRMNIYSEKGRILCQK